MMVEMMILGCSDVDLWIVSHQLVKCPEPHNMWNLICQSHILLYMIW